MKKAILTIIILMITFNLASYAQNPFKERISLYFKGGVTSSTFGELDKGTASKSRISYDLGIIGDYRFNKRYSLQSGVSLTSLSSELSVDEYMTIKATRRYVKLPLYIVRSFDLSFIQIRVLAGAYYAYGVGGKLRNSYLQEDEFLSQPDKTNFFSHFSKTDFGLSGGIEIFYNKNIGVYGKYNYGLKKISVVDSINNTYFSAGLLIRL